MKAPRVYIVILNWNGWKDTIECLESVFRLDHDNYRVIVCDNNSSDGSLEHIKAWADGRLDVYLPQDSQLRHITFPPVSKAIPYHQYDKGEAESGGNRDDDCPLILIETGANLGFAGGNNVGLRYVLARDSFDYIWLLNNDTIVRLNSLSTLVTKMIMHPNAGMCGSTLLYYHDPEETQALGGGSYNKWLGTSQLFNCSISRNAKYSCRHIEKKLNFICGASMLVTKHFLEDIGLLVEDYFLYYEEIDWALRAGTSYTLVYAERCVVYHKEGVSIGGSNWNKNYKSLVSDFYSIRNRIILALKYHPYTLPTVYMCLILTAIRRVARGQWRRILMIIKIGIAPQKYSVSNDRLIKIIAADRYPS
jgi:GT2 family glycosyltransferase